MSSNFSYTFPAIRGVQAGREFYVSMCPLRLLGRIFSFDDEELMPELRAQRTLNHSRIPDMARYITQNTSDYTFSAITASIDGEVKFEPVGSDDIVNFRMGSLKVSMDAKFIVNDGQHRRAAIQQALQINPELGEETIAVVFFLDRGLERCQQMFADLNRYAVKPSASLGILYDHRNTLSYIAKKIGLTSTVFRNLIETENSSLSPRSRKLFTLSALNFAITELLTDEDLMDIEAATTKAMRFWDMVGNEIPEWAYVRESKLTSGDVRRDFIHSHAIVLQSLGRVGKAIYAQDSHDVESRIAKLSNIDWSRANFQTWEGRAMIGGTMAKTNQNIVLTTNEIKRMIGVDLSPEEAKAETAYRQARANVMPIV